MHFSFDPRLVVASAQPRPPDANTENEIDDIKDHHFEAKPQKGMKSPLPLHMKQILKLP